MDMLWIIFACGVGTFLLRWIPFRHARYQSLSRSGSTAVGRILGGVGPAAISALFTVSVWGALSPDIALGPLTRTVVALAVVILVRVLGRGGVAMPTLSGALAYGLLSGL